MKWPELVPAALCKTPIKVTVYGEKLDENGAPIVAASADTLCNWQSSGQIVRTNKTHMAQLTGVALLRL